jgi:hypothetical protein
VTVLPAYIPPDINMQQVQADVKDSGVSVPPADQAEVPALRQIVADAAHEGIDLKIVVVDVNPAIDTPLRDIATEVGHANPGSTVLALGPSFAGTYSPVFDRVTLEAGQDLARTGDPVQSSENFLGELTNPHFDWTPFTIVLVLAVALAVIGTRILQVKGKRADVTNAASISSD